MEESHQQGIMGQCDPGSKILFPVCYGFLFDSFPQTHKV
uniref:Uncharacterized protein n=1 Tax=Xenopus tropicalis TaxID=8364 RepID=A0A1B8Y2T4_XENTR